ncbi:MAG: AsmA family protein [Myxococcota bacterium]
MTATRRVPLLGFGALIVVTVAGVLWTLVNADALARQVARMLAQHLLGPTVERVQVRRWSLHTGDPWRVVLTDVRVPPVPPATDPPVHLPRVEIPVDPWQLLPSRGDELSLGVLRLDHPTWHLTRRDDGTLGVAGDPHALRTRLDELRREWSHGRVQRVAGVEVTGGRVFLDDVATGETRVVEEIALTLGPLQAGREVNIKATMSVEHDRHRAPVTLEATVGPHFQEPSVSRELRAHLVVQGLELSAWGFLVPPMLVRPHAGALSTDVVVERKGEADTITVQGRVHVANLVLAHQSARGEPATLSGEVDVAWDGASKLLDVRKLDVSGTALRLKTRLKVTGPALEGVHQALVDLHVDELKQLVALLPPADGAVPEGLKLEGPVDLRLEGDARQGALRVELDQARLAWGEWVDKPAGVPMHLRLDANREGDRIRFSNVKMVLDEATVVGRAELAGPAWLLEGEADSDAVPITQLQRVYPAIAQAVQRGGKVTGLARVRGRARAVAGQQALDAQVMLSGVDVSGPWLVARGNGVLSADVNPGPAQTVVTLDGRLDDMAVRVLDKEHHPVVDKPRGHPANVTVRILHDGKQASVENADLVVGKTVMRVRGRAERLDQPGSYVDLRVEPFHVAFDDLRVVSDVADAFPPGGQLDARLRITGNPRAPRSMQVVAESLEVRTALSRLRGRAQVKDLLDPHVHLDLAEVDIDAREVLQLHRAGALPRQADDVVAHLPTGARLWGKAVVTGRMAVPESVAIKASPVRLTSGRSEVNGEVALVNLVSLSSEGHLTTSELRLMDVRTPASPAWLPLDGKLAGQVRWRRDAGRPEHQEVELTELRVRTQGSDFTVSGVAYNALTPQLDLAVTGSTLDAGALQALWEKAHPPVPNADPRAALPEDTRTRLQRTRAVVSVELDRVFHDRTVLDDVVVMARLEKGTLTLDRLLFNTLGGEVDANGSRVELAATRVRTRLDVTVRGLDLSELARVHLRDPDALAGRVDVSANVTTVGLRREDLVSSLDGTFSVESPEVRARDFVLHYRVLAPTETLRPIETGGQEQAAHGDPRPYFRDLSAAGRVEGETLTFTQPLLCRSSFGDLNLGGAVDLRRGIQLTGTTDMSPEAVARMSQGAVRPRGRVVAPLTLGGAYDKPVLERLDLSNLAERTGPPELLGAAQALARRGVAQARDDVERLRRQAEEGARAEARRMQEEMRRERESALQQQVAQARRYGVGGIWNGMAPEEPERSPESPSSSVDGGSAH